MPIPTNSKENKNLFGYYPKDTSKMIKFMKNIGLISDDNSTYRYNSKNNICKTYRYYYENEIKIINYCNKESISKECIPKNTLVSTFDLPENYADKIKISSHITGLRKPKEISEREFEASIRNILFAKYSDMEYYMQKAEHINDVFYKDYPDFKVKFEPNINIIENKGGTICNKIGIRATNKLCSAKKDHSCKNNH